LQVVAIAAIWAAASLIVFLKTTGFDEHDSDVQIMLVNLLVYKILKKLT